MGYETGLVDGVYVGIYGQAPARANATAVLTVRNPRFWRGIQEIAFEDRGEAGVLVTGMWDNAVAFSALETREEARRRWRSFTDKGATRTK